MLDLLLRGGRIIDGTGAAWFRGDIAVKDGQIVAMGDCRESQATRIINVDGAVVAPGFIDIHTHSDISLLINARGESKVRQGVTTEVVGNCGASFAPLAGIAVPDTEKGLLSRDLELTWRTMGEYLDRVDSAHPAQNVAALVGLGTIRQSVVGDDDRPATAAEIAAMQALIAQAMGDGAFGISSGLIYAPGSFADTDELVEMAKVAARYGGFYATHMRNESDRLLEAVGEAIAIGARAGAPVQISHHKAVGPDNWGKVKDSLAAIESARRRGLDVTVDQYPYVATSTGLASVLPLWVHDGGTAALLARLQDPAVLPRIRSEAEAACQKTRKGWEKVYLCDAADHSLQHLEGKHLVDVARELGMAPVDAAIHVLLCSRAQAEMVGFGMCEEDVRLVMRHPLTMIGSDSVAVAPYGPLGAGKPHPRTYGTFPRVLGRYVREQEVITLEEAVRKMTALPAHRLGLWNRGILRPGMVADITVFDPETVIDSAEYADPHQYPVGIPYVIVAGTPVIDGGEHTGAGPGRALRRGSC